MKARCSDFEIVFERMGGENTTLAAFAAGAEH
jgi:hypothetical protein